MLWRMIVERWRTRSDGKLKEKNDNCGLLLCWHLLCDYLNKRLWSTIHVRFSQRRLSMRWRICMEKIVTLLVLPLITILAWGVSIFSGNLECHRNSRTIPISRISRHDNFHFVRITRVAHCNRVHFVGGKMNTLHSHRVARMNISPHSVGGGV